MGRILIYKKYKYSGTDSYFNFEVLARSLLFKHHLQVGDNFRYKFWKLGNKADSQIIKGLAGCPAVPPKETLTLRSLFGKMLPRKLSASTGTEVLLVLGVSFCLIFELENKDNASVSSFHRHKKNCACFDLWKNSSRLKKINKNYIKAYR